MCLSIFTLGSTPFSHSRLRRSSLLHTNCNPPSLSKVSRFLLYLPCRLQEGDKMMAFDCQTLTEQRNIDRWITDSRVLSTLQFIEANRGGLSGKLPTLFTNQQAALFASYPNCFWVIWHISTLLCYIWRYDFEFWKSPVVEDLPNNKQYLACDVQEMHTFLFDHAKRKI